MIDADRIREATDTVLGRPAYDELSPTITGRAWEEFRSAIADLLADLFLSPTASTFGRIVAYGVVTVVVVLLVVAVVGLRRRSGAAVVLDVSSTAGVLDLVDEADRCRRAGDLEGAVRARYGALLVTLVEADVLSGRPGTTVGEVDAAVTRSLPAAAGAVQLAGRSLSEVVYGHREPSVTDDEEVAAALAVLRAELPTLAVQA